MVGALPGACVSAILLAWPSVVAAQLSGAPVRYPLQLPYADCPQRLCGTWQLVDAELQSGPEPLGGFRLRYGNVGIAGFTWAHDRKVASLEGARVSARYEDHDDGSALVTVAYRAARWRLRAEGLRGADAIDGTWSFGGGVAFRPSTGFEIEATWRQAVQDLTPAFAAERSRRLGRLALRWQHGTRLEIGAAARSEQIVDGLGESAPRWGLEARAEWLAGVLALAGALDYADTGGRFADRQLTGALRAEARVAGHWLLQASADERVSLGISEVSRGVRAGVAFFGRRYRFARGGLAAAAADVLARAAQQAGYDERREFTQAGQWAQRERLSLFAAAVSLRAAIDGLYDAEVADRNVEQLAIEVRESRQREIGSRIWTVHGRIGIPWPIAWPWSVGEDRVEFIRLFGSYTVATYTEEAQEYGRQLGALVWLNRELAARVAWESPHRTPLDLALGRLGDDWVIATLRWRLGY